MSSSGLSFLFLSSMEAIFHNGSTLSRKKITLMSFILFFLYIKYFSLFIWLTFAKKSSRQSYLQLKSHTFIFELAVSFWMCADEWIH